MTVSPSMFLIVAPALPLDRFAVSAKRHSVVPPDPGNWTSPHLSVPVPLSFHKIRA